MHHDTMDNDAPHGLGVVGQQYFEVPCWKGAADDKYFTGITDMDLHAYCTVDCLVVLRLYPILLDEIYKAGTFGQYEQDRQILPHARNMGDLGFFIDEKRRGILAIKMSTEAEARYKKLIEIVGDENFNPNSAHHIRK